MNSNYSAFSHWEALRVEALEQAVKMTANNGRKVAAREVIMLAEVFLGFLSKQQ